MFATYVPSSEGFVVQVFSMNAFSIERTKLWGIRPTSMDFVFMVQCSFAQQFTEGETEAQLNFKGFGLDVFQLVGSNVRITIHQ